MSLTQKSHIRTKECVTKGKNVKHGYIEKHVNSYLLCHVLFSFLFLLCSFFFFFFLAQKHNNKSMSLEAIFDRDKLGSLTVDVLQQRIIYNDIILCCLIDMLLFLQEHCLWLHSLLLWRKCIFLRPNCLQRLVHNILKSSSRHFLWQP